MLAWAAHCRPQGLCCKHIWGLQRLHCHPLHIIFTGPSRACRKTAAPKALPDDSGKLGALPKKIQERQKTIEEQLAELKEIAGRLTPEEREDLLEAIKQNDTDAREQEQQAEEADYPKPVRDILEAAGVLDAMPYTSEPVLAGDSGVALPRPLSYEWSNEDFVDDGQQLSDEEWSVFFQTQLENIRKEAAGEAEGSRQDDTDPDDPFQGLPDPFDDDLILPGDDIPFEPGEGVEEFLQLLEAGKPLPPDPRQVGRPKESAHGFLTRMDKLQARYEAQFLKRKEWQISPEDVKALDAQWEEVAMRSDVPITMDDIQEVTPAPDIPPEVERQMKRLEWIAYRLRRAYLEGTPSQPVQALASAGLLAENAIYRDIVMECRGMPAVMDYANRMDWTYGNAELCQIWGHMSEHRPVPEWYVMVDSWLNLPYPDWYLEYIRVHFQAALFPDAFMGAFANAVRSDDDRLEKVLEQYRQWGRKVRGLPRNRRERKQLEHPVLWKDAYADRPFTNQQRLRTGALPVLERNPAVTIDDTEALGSPDDMLKDPFLDTRVADFVTDPARGKPRFAGVADDPYGSGRHLLLPLLRRMQHGGSRIISFAQGKQWSLRAPPVQHSPSMAAEGAAATNSQLSSSARCRSTWRHASSGPAGKSAASEVFSDTGAAASGSAAQQELPIKRPTADAQGMSAETAPEATDQSAANHSISMQDALQASKNMARDWAAGRLSLEYPPAEDDDVDAVSSKPAPDQASMQGASSAAVLHAVLSSLQQVKPGVLASTQLPAGLDAATVEKLSLRQRAGDDTAAKALAALRCRGVFAGRERPKPEMPKPWQQTLAAAAGRPFHIDAPSHTVRPPLEPWRYSCQVDTPAGSSAAAASVTFLSAASMPSKAGASAEASASRAPCLPMPSRTDSSRAGWRLHPVPLWHKWYLRQKKAQSRTLEALKAQSPLKRMRAAQLHNEPTTAHSSSARLRRVDAVVQAASSFVGSGRSKKEQDRTFRLLAYAPFARNATSPCIRQASSTELSSFSSPVAEQESSGMQQGKPASTSELAESDPGPSRQLSLGSPRQIIETGKRLSFQWGCGFESDSTPNRKQQVAIPDLVSLMCSTSSDSPEADAIWPIEAQAGGDDDAVHAEGGDGAETTPGTKDAGQESAQDAGEVPGKAGGPPRKRPLGTAWRDGSHMTIPMTTMYELNPATGQVDRITSHWNGYIMHGLHGAEQEAWDIYARQTRLYELMGRPSCSIRFVRRNMGPTDPDVALDL